MPDLSTRTAIAHLTRRCDAWDAMHRHYFPDYDERWQAVINAAAAHDLGEAPRILDLGCGPGTLTRQLQEAIPRAQVVGVDADPMLVAMARAIPTPASLSFLQARIGSPEAGSLLHEVGPFDAIVSSAFVHYFHHRGLIRLHRLCRGIMRDRGILVTAERFAAPPAGRRRPTGVRSPAEAPASPWTTWWNETRTDPLIMNQAGHEVTVAAAAELGRSVGIPSTAVEPPPLTLADYLTTLTASGFDDPHTAPTSGNSTVVTALSRPSPPS